MLLWKTHFVFSIERGKSRSLCCELLMFILFLTLSLLLVTSANLTMATQTQRNTYKSLSFIFVSRASNTNSFIIPFFVFLNPDKLMLVVNFPRIFNADCQYEWLLGMTVGARIILSTSIVHRTSCTCRSAISTVIVLRIIFLNRFQSTPLQTAPEKVRHIHVLQYGNYVWWDVRCVAL